MLVAVRIASFAVQADRNTPLVILRETGGARTVAVPVASMEASAIAMKSLNVRCDKPLAVDALKIVIEALGAKLDKVVLRADSGEFSSRLHIYSDANVKVIECGSGDGIALAIRCAAPLFVDETLFSRDGVARSSEEAQALRLTIASEETLEFGSYHLQ